MTPSSWLVVALLSRATLAHEPAPAPPPPGTTPALDVLRGSLHALAAGDTAPLLLTAWRGGDGLRRAVACQRSGPSVGCAVYTEGERSTSALVLRIEGEALVVEHAGVRHAAALPAAHGHHVVEVALSSSVSTAEGFRPEPLAMPERVGFRVLPAVLPQD